MTHPGIFLKEEYLDYTGLTITEIAKRLGVSRKTLSQLVNGKQGISGDMAFRLSRALEHTTAHEWLYKQLEYDLELAADAWSVSGVQITPLFNEPHNIMDYHFSIRMQSGGEGEFS